MDVIIFSMINQHIGAAQVLVCSTKKEKQNLSMANTNHVERVWCYPETMIHLYILGMKENRGAAREKKRRASRNKRKTKETKEIVEHKKQVLLGGSKQKPHMTHDIQCFLKVPSGNYFGGSVTMPSYSRERIYSNVRWKWRFGPSRLAFASSSLVCRLE